MIVNMTLNRYNLDNVTVILKLIFTILPLYQKSFHLLNHTSMPVGATGVVSDTHSQPDTILRLLKFACVFSP